MSFSDCRERKDENAYFRKRADMLATMNRRIFKPKFNATGPGVAKDGSTV